MARIYDVRDAEPSSDDEPYEALGILFNTGAASPHEDDSEASGSSDTACDDDVDEGNEMEHSGITNNSKKPSETDSVEVIDVSNNPHDEIAESVPSESPIESFENRGAEPKYELDDRSQSVDQKELVNSPEKDTLESLIDFGIDPDLFHQFQKFMDFQIATNNINDQRRTGTINCVGKGTMTEVPYVVSSGESSSNSQPDPSMSGVKQDIISCSTSVQGDAIPEPDHRTKYKPTRVSLKSIGKFSSQNEKEYIKAKGLSSAKMLQLGFSARLTYDQLNLVIHNEGSLLVTDDNFVAKVRLDRPQLLCDARHFAHATEVLLNELRIERVLLDEVTAERDRQRELFLKRLEHVVKHLAADETQMNTRIELLNFVERSKRKRILSYVEICGDVMNNQFNDETLHNHAKKLERIELKACRRERLFKRLMYCPKDYSPNLLMRLNGLAKEIVDYHRGTLFAKAPAFLHKALGTISLKHLMLINSSDVKQFTDMAGALKPEIFEKPLQDLANRWINRVKSIKLDRLNRPLQLTSVSLFFICKSLEEVILEITERTDHQATDLLVSSNLGWSPIRRITWKTENALTKCLQREYQFIFRLLKHFEAASDFGSQPFQYETQLFNNGQSTVRRVLSEVKSAIVRTGRYFGYARPKPNPFGVPDDFYVWYCLLDDVLYHILPSGCELVLFGTVFEEYVQMIRGANYDQMETLRVVTHNLVRFIAQSCSYDRNSSVDATLDKAILRKQLNIFSFKTGQSVLSANNFRDQVDVLNRFWNTRSDIIDQFPMKINLPEMNLIQERLMEIMQMVLDKSVEADTMVAFCRTYNDFILDLNEVSFDWYIKDIPESDMQSVINLGKIELVDNKWKDTNNRTYRVLDPENFPTFCKGLGKTGNVPKHYVIEVILTQLEHICSQLQRISWEAGGNLSDTDQVLSTNELIFAIRSSLLYLKEQIDYVSFDLFYDERVKPFANALKTTTSRQDFSNRINLIKESFWYIRKQNEISFEDALQLYDGLNSSHDSQLLRESYAKYSTFFEEFMQLSIQEECFKRALFIAKKVKSLLSNPIQFKTWDDRFKQNLVPRILAGLGAVWSILMSKDVANAGKYFNPHCIQILCVLRLLSVDKPDQGVDKHLAEVLTGQGKSLVLGLLAALFALTGHRVRIACYCKYLAKRDKQDFLAFYDLFSVANEVTYGTFDDLANEVIAPTVNGRTIQLRDLVQDLLFKEKAILPHRLVTADSSNDVLLMDEVDVFFTKDFYGNTYNPGFTPLVPGLNLIQEQIE